MSRQVRQSGEGNTATSLSWVKKTEVWHPVYLWPVFLAAWISRWCLTPTFLQFTPPCSKAFLYFTDELWEMPLPFPTTNPQPGPSKHLNVESIQMGAFFFVSCARTKYLTKNNSTGGGFILPYTLRGYRLSQQEKLGGRSKWPFGHSASADRRACKK